MAVTWAIRHPDRMVGVVPVATSPRLTSQALAFDVVGRNAIITDPAYQGGQYYDVLTSPPTVWRSRGCLGTSTYLSREAMTRKFDPQRLEPRALQTDFENTNLPSDRIWRTRGTSLLSGSTPTAISR